MKRIARLLGCSLWIIVAGSAWCASESTSDIAFPPPAPKSDETREMDYLLDKDINEIEMLDRRTVQPAPSVPTPFSGVDTDCLTGVPTGKIDLSEAITRALCTNPRTRQTWAAARAQAAQVGIEEAAFLPKASASIDAGRSRVRQDETDQNVTTTTRATAAAGTASLDFTWLLFDFGQRDASVTSARQTLLAATAIHDDTVQTVFLDTASAYYALIAAQRTYAVAKEVEQFSLHTLAAAEEHSKGNGTDLDEADRLQAKLAAIQATLDRGRAKGNLQEAQGELALLIGVSPDVELTVDTNDAPTPDQGKMRSINELMEQARATHPMIRAAQARVFAAQASIDTAKRLYRPTVSLVQGNHWERDALGVDTKENRLSLQLNIPLFEGAHSYQKRAALAELDSAQAEAMNTEQKVALDVWIAFQNIKAESAALDTSRPLLKTARELLKVEKDLFTAGDGDMLDLIFAQQSVADASLENLQALTNWHIARLRLAASLGQLGFWTIRKTGDTK